MVNNAYYYYYHYCYCYCYYYDHHHHCYVVTRKHDNAWLTGNTSAQPARKASTCGITPDCNHLTTSTTITASTTTQTNKYPTDEHERTNAKNTQKQKTQETKERGNVYERERYSYDSYER